MNVGAKMTTPVRRSVSISIVNRSGMDHEGVVRVVRVPEYSREKRASARVQAHSCKAQLSLSHSLVICSVTSRCSYARVCLMFWRSAFLVFDAGVHVSYL